MRLPILTACALCIALPATAQESTVKNPATKDASAAKIQVFGGTSSRPNTGVFLFGENIAAGITISHGQPEWTNDYANLDQFKGQLIRLGKDQWTTLMTSVPVDIGGTTVPAGSYVCGLSCDKSGKFGLALIDSTKAMKAGLMPFTMPQTWTPDITVPLTLNKDVSKEVVSKLSIELKGNKQEPTKATFTLAWGPHTLTSPVTFNVTK
jgi:hypothetical protein